MFAFLDELRDSAGRPGGPPGLWLLVPTDAQEEKPTLDGQPVPVFTTAQWARIPEPWLAARTEAYKRLFPEGDYPANTLLIISGLARPELMVEVSAIARLPD